MVIGQLYKCPVVINVPLDPRPQLVTIRVQEVRHSARMTNKRDEDMSCRDESLRDFPRSKKGPSGITGIKKTARWIFLVATQYAQKE